MLYRRSSFIYIYVNKFFKKNYTYLLLEDLLRISKKPMNLFNSASFLNELRTINTMFVRNGIMRDRDRESGLPGPELILIAHRSIRVKRPLSISNNHLELNTWPR